MSEHRLSDAIYLLLSKVLKLNVKAEFSLCYDEENNKHRRLDFILFLQDKVHVLELKTEKITSDIVIDTIFNKNYLTLSLNYLKDKVKSLDDVTFYFINKEGVTEDALEKIQLCKYVEYVELKSYIKDCIEEALVSSEGITPINVLGSVSKDYKFFVEEEYLRELRNRYSLYDKYRNLGY